LRIIFDLFSIDDLNKLIKLVDKEHKKVLKSNLDTKPNPETIKWNGLLQKLNRLKEEKQNVRRK